MARSHPELMFGLSPADADALLALGTRMRVPAGTELFRIGTPADSIFLVEQGRIALTMPIQVLGREQDVLIEERTPGQALGWSALIPPHRFTLNATAPHDAEVMAIARDALARHFVEHPAVGYVVTRNVAEIVGQRLQVVQAMWLREMQRVIALRASTSREVA